MAEQRPICLHSMASYGSSSYNENDSLLVDEQRERKEEPHIAVKGRRPKSHIILKYFIVATLCLIILSASILNKLTIVSLTDALRHYSGISIWNSSNDSNLYRDEQKVVVLHWQLLTILLVPNIVTFLRCLFFSVLGKTTENYPWPCWWAIILGAIGAVVEAAAHGGLIYLVLPVLFPGASIFVLSGVFMVQIPLDLIIDCVNNCHLQNARQRIHCARNHKLLLLFNTFLKVIAILLQWGGLVCLIVFLVKNSTNTLVITPAIAIPASLLILSVIWSSSFQKVTSTAGSSTKTARYRSSLINSFVRITVYPFITYTLFRYCTNFDVDPWCLKSNCSVHFSGDSLPIMILHIVSSFVGYAAVWVSCTMTLQKVVLGLSLLLSTVVAEVIYFSLNFLEDASLFFGFHHEIETFAPYFPLIPIFAGLLWVGGVIGKYIVFSCKTNIILAEDKDMFFTPHYDSVLLEQHMILNRCVGKEMTNPANQSVRPPRTIFICSTMYRENQLEMEELLKSMYLVAKHYSIEYQNDARRCDKFESHIFFDGAICANSIENFGLQLLAILHRTLDVKIENCIKKKTPYGYRLEWTHEDIKLPFFIHFKDKTLVKAKKRWSQVMYMSYILDYRKKKQDFDLERIFILTTDGDIEFNAESTVALLDRLESSSNVAGVCARTHPKGHGLLYWYQLFDYAIGHWFQKPAEHILGSVLCSPGCFSIFRCSALNEVFKEYSTEVDGALEFLMKDMGEDRWLCTLLTQKGLRLEYCAISENRTNCPTSFNEFFKQRRRWIPSTVANLVTLISKSGRIMKKNDSITFPFILFQLVMIFSLAISPATVILVIAAGLETFSIPFQATISILFILSILYALVCLYASPKAQLQVSKLLTFAFVLIMAVVIIGMFKDIVNSLVGEQQQNCAKFIVGGYKAPEYYKCVRESGIEANSTEDVEQHFVMAVPMTVVYIGALAVTFLLASVLHPSEMYCILHSIWFLLGLPSGYLLLIIYSAANLCDQSWGTREKSSEDDEGGSASPQKDELMLQVVENSDNAPRELLDGEEGTHQESSLGPCGDLEESVKEWLIKQDCQCYEDAFKNNGYTQLNFIASMSLKDLEEIGVDKIGFRLRLQKAIKQLPPFNITVDLPVNVEGWLADMELSEYTDLFRRYGYMTEEDIVNLKVLDKNQLIKMGITKKAHLQRLQMALASLKSPSELELQKIKAKKKVSDLNENILTRDEEDFWNKLIRDTLKPIPEQFKDSLSIKKSLQELRNTVLALLLLINTMWIVTLNSFSFWQLSIYGIDPRAFNTLFLAVYGLIIVIQFVTMLAHRAVTFIHYMGRTKSKGLCKGCNSC